MNRRELLATSAVGGLLGTGGCISDLDPREENTTESDDEITLHENAVPGCTSKAEWRDGSPSGPAEPDPDTIAGRRNCANADRPEPTGDVCETVEVEGEDGEITEFHSAGVKPYPNSPSDFDKRTLQSFVSEYERAYTQNWAVSRHGKNTVEFSFTTHETKMIDGYDEIVVVLIEFGFAFRPEDGSGTSGYHDAFGEVAIYGIDETGIVRIEPDNYDPSSDLEELPDPIEDGDLLQCF